MIQHLPPHPQRDVLTGELHARPPLPLQTPVAISRLALSGEAGGERGAGVAHLAALCRRYGVTPPAPGSDFVMADFGAFRVRYERHTEFDGWTFLRPGLSDHPEDPFAFTAIAAVPTDWLAALPGRTLVAAHIAVLPTAGEVKPRPPAASRPMAWPAPASPAPPPPPGRISAWARTASPASCCRTTA